jgi:anti-anti-sigma factor
MTHLAQIRLAVPQPPGMTVIELVPNDGRLVTGLEAGPAADATHLADDLWQYADQSNGPIVLNMGSVNWIDSGACAVLIRFWKELRARGRPLTLHVTGPVRETFRITGLIRLVPCFGDLESAISAARTAQPTGEP